MSTNRIVSPDGSKNEWLPMDDEDISLIDWIRGYEAAASRMGNPAATEQGPVSGLWTEYAAGAIMAYEMAEIAGLLWPVEVQR